MVMMICCWHLHASHLFFGLPSFPRSGVHFSTVVSRLERGHLEGRWFPAIIHYSGEPLRRLLRSKVTFPGARSTTSEGITPPTEVMHDWRYVSPPTDAGSYCVKVTFRTEDREPDLHLHPRALGLEWGLLHVHHTSIWLKTLILVGKDTS